MFAKLETRIPPPLAALIACALMWLIAQALPALAVTVPARPRVVALFAFGGLALDLIALAHFLRRHTTINPLHPDRSKALVIEGIYRFTRNPMYVGLVMLLVAWAIELEHPLTLGVVPLFVAYVNRFQIIPEERALAARFGQAYLDYTHRVPRWLWPRSPAQGGAHVRN